MFMQIGEDAAVPEVGFILTSAGEPNDFVEIVDCDRTIKDAEVDPDACTITGVVMIDNPRHPGSYAWAESKAGSRVMLLQNDAVMAEGETIAGGKFVFEGVTPGAYVVKGARKQHKPMKLPVNCTAAGNADAKLFLAFTDAYMRNRGKKGKGKGKKKY